MDEWLKNSAAQLYHRILLRDTKGQPTNACYSPHASPENDAQGEKPTLKLSYGMIPFVNILQVAKL